MNRFAAVPQGQVSKSFRIAAYNDSELKVVRIAWKE